MPRLSDSMEEGTVLGWMKSVGDEVAVGDELVEIETDKANMVYEADEAGTLIEIVAEEGATLPIGEVIARIGEAGDGEAGDGADADGAEPKGKEEDDDAETDAPKAEDARQETQASVAEDEGTASEPDDGERIKASPLARRIARDQGVDLASLSGSGPGGRIVKADVEGAEAAASPPADDPAKAEAAGGRTEDGDAQIPEEQKAAEAGAAPAAAEPTAGAKEKPETARGSAEAFELTRLQQTVARRMAESKATAPHFYLTSDIDMTRAVDARKRLKSASRDGDVVPSFNDMVVKACAMALREFPRANGAYRDGKVEEYSRVNIGVAVAARDALVVPTVFDADGKGLRQIAVETRALAARVREGTITPPELSGGTFTVSNLGMFGVSSFSAVINPPQAAILAVGAIAEIPMVSGGEIAVGSSMSVTLACDHRILYGSDGAEFLARIRDLLEEPVFLAL